MKKEVRIAVKSMKKGKAVGEDSVALEMIIALGDFVIDELTKLINRVFESGYRRCAPLQRKGAALPLPLPLRAKKSAAPPVALSNFQYIQFFHAIMALTALRCIMQ